MSRKTIADDVVDVGAATTAPRAAVAAAAPRAAQGASRASSEDAEENEEANSSSEGQSACAAVAAGAGAAKGWQLSCRPFFMLFTTLELLLTLRFSLNDLGRLCPEEAELTSTPFPQDDVPICKNGLLEVRRGRLPGASLGGLPTASPEQPLCLGREQQLPPMLFTALTSPRERTLIGDAACHAGSNM